MSVQDESRAPLTTVEHKTHPTQTSHILSVTVYNLTYYSSLSDSYYVIHATYFVPTGPVFTRNPKTILNRRIPLKIVLRLPVNTDPGHTCVYFRLS